MVKEYLVFERGLLCCQSMQKRLGVAPSLAGTGALHLLKKKVVFFNVLLK